MSLEQAAGQASCADVKFAKIFNYLGIRRGSCLDTNRATVAMVTDDPEHKSAMKEQLANAFGGEECKSPCFVY